MFEIQELTKYFGGLCAVHKLNMALQPGEIVGLIGPNGAGKTTVFNLITGFHKPSRGKIEFKGKSIAGKKPHHIAKRGIARTFQIAKLFNGFTVMQNMRAGSHLSMKTGLFQAVFHTGKYRKKESESLNYASRTLEMLGLYPWVNELAETLPHSHQKLLGIGIALATRPELLLLDEPLEGMNAGEVDNALEIIDKLNRRGTTVLLIEHNMRAVMKICKRIVVLNFGEVIAEGTPEEIQKDRKVIEAYLGEGDYAHQSENQ